MSRFDSDFLILLERNGVHSTIQDEMKRLNCTSLAVFANWVEGRNDLRDAFMSATDKKDDAGQLARLKMAWRQAEAMVEKGLKRTSEGLTEVPFDEPLDDGTQKSVQDLFRTTWRWPNLPPERMGADALLGRIYREFQARKPTLIPVAKVRSLSDSQSRVSGSSRRRLGDRLALIVDGEGDEDTSDVVLFMQFITTLEVLGNTWAVAGTFEATWDSSTINYAAWPAVYDYVTAIRDEGASKLGDYTEASVLQYVTLVEEAFRTEAIKLARAEPPMPWGMALTRSLERKATLWDHKAGSLVRRSNAQGAPLRERTRNRQRGSGGGKGQKGKGREEPPPSHLVAAPPPPQLALADSRPASSKERGDYSKKWNTSKYDSKNNVICKQYNDPRGCKLPCPQNRSHVCDVWLAAGRVCGSPHHNRRTHSVKDHGVPQTGH